MIFIFMPLTILSINIGISFTLSKINCTMKDVSMSTKMCV